MVPASGSVSLRSTLQVEGYDRLSDREVANAINSAFLEPMNVFVSLESIPPFEEESEVLIVSEAAVSSALKKLNPLKASGPDNSFAEQRLPTAWKLADVVPVPKQKPVEDVNKHLRPISLTPTISKVAEDFVVA